MVLPAAQAQVVIAALDALEDDIALRLAGLHRSSCGRCMVNSFVRGNPADGTNVFICGLGPLQNVLMAIRHAGYLFH